MSTYYTYYLGYRGKDGMIYPLGPYNKSGELKSVVCKSRTFASDLHEEFLGMSRQIASEELQNALLGDYKAEENWYGFYWLSLNDMPEGNYIKSGYYPIENVSRFEQNQENGELPIDNELYFSLSPTSYAGLATSGGAVENYINDKKLKASDFMYYKYEDYTSKEWETFLIRKYFDVMEDDVPKGCEPVVILVVG